MKMTGKQFKTLIKECLKELIEEGHFQQMMMESMGNRQQPQYQQPPQVQFGMNPVQNQGMINPNVAALVNDMSKGNPNAANHLLEIFADTAANHPHVHGERFAQHMGSVGMAGGYHQSPGGWDQNEQPHMLNEHQRAPVAPQPPKQNNGFASRWAELAFSKSQRPGF